MFIKQIYLKNIRGIEELTWDLGERRRAGWHVVIGDNASGKSTFLRAVALAMIGPDDAIALREDWHNWLRFGEEAGQIRVSIEPHEPFDIGFSQGKGRRASPTARLDLKRTRTGVRLTPPARSADNAHNHIWGEEGGWFSASYGPFRRFTGGDREFEALLGSHARLARHLSIFGENVALTECVEWLKLLRFRQLEGGKREKEMLEQIVRFVNQAGLLPHGVEIREVTSESVVFRDGSGEDIDVTLMSDGYRSILSFTFELIRQLAETYGPEKVFRHSGKVSVVDVPGVVLVDEIDAHLHPTWQRSIGQWFTKHFPKIQFIVTTHSPLVCQAAENSTIFRLPTPGSNQEKMGMVEDLVRDRLIYGDILDAYGTEMFGDSVGRSDISHRKLDRLAELNQKALYGNLSQTELEEKSQLEAIFPAPHVPDAS